MILLKDDTFFSEEQKDRVHNIISEHISFVYDSDDKSILITRVLESDIDRNLININEEIGVAYIPLGKATLDVKNRVRLAQQLSQLLIINQ